MNDDLSIDWIIEDLGIGRSIDELSRWSDAAADVR
jgi:hypothetical protein